MEISFRAILYQYLDRLDLNIRRYKNNIISKKEFNDLRYENLKWFHFIRDSSTDLDKCKVIKTIKDKRILSQKRFLLPEKDRCPGCEDGKPYEIIKYRNHMIPIYSDDYGQQDFARIFENIVSGGCYNFFSEIEFMNYVDYRLEEKIINNEYNFKDELRLLFPEWEDNK